MTTGDAYLSDDLRRELNFLGMTSLPSLAGEPAGDGVAQRFIRTPKDDLP
jgi:hypothetical protein